MHVICTDPRDPSQPCPICSGMGMVVYDVPMEHPAWGKMTRCPNLPVQAEGDRLERMRQLSHLDAFKDKTLDNFIVNRQGYPQTVTTILMTAHRAALRFAEHPQGWMVFTGGYGSGKTHLAVGIGHERLRRGDSVLFLTVPDLLDHLRNTYSANSEVTYDSFFDHVRNVNLLILDDLGAENPSAWAQEKLFQLLNHRYVRHLPTVITSNVPLERLDPRISSRLQDLEMVTHFIINAPDFRSKMPQQDTLTLTHMGHYMHMTFENFDVVSRVTADEQANLTKAWKQARHFVDKPAQERGWLMLLGTFGAGKTHLAAAIANACRAMGEAVEFATVSDLLDRLRASYSPDAQLKFDSVFHKFREAPLLVLDDLNGDIAAKSWAQEKLFQLLDYRYVGRMATVITTSQEFEAFERIAPRLFTRLCDTRVCQRVVITARSYTLRLRGK